MRRGNIRAAGALAAAALTVTGTGLLIPWNVLQVHAQVELMEDGALFDPVWFREQYSEAKGNHLLADEEEETADAAATETKMTDSEKSDAVGTEETETGENETEAASDADSANLDKENREDDGLTAKVNNAYTESGSAGEAADDSYELVSTEGLTVTELYRLYQLYGKREGLLPYDYSTQNGTMFQSIKKASAAYISSKERTLGDAWNVLTSTIYDTDDVYVWGTEYIISQQTRQKLQEAIDLFEEDGYEVGFVLADLKTGDAISYHAGAQIYSASVIKAPYIFSLLEAGNEPTNDMYLAGNQSDNDAYARIRSRYGNEAFTDWLQETGIPASQGSRRYIITTPLDLCRMFYKGTSLLLGDEEYSDWARNTFTDSLNSAVALTVGTEEGKTVYSKAGWIASAGNSVENSYTNAAVVDGEYPYVVAIMSNSMGYVGVEYAKELMPILDDIHDEMVNPEKAAGSTEVTAEDITDFAGRAQSAARSN